MFQVLFPHSYNPKMSLNVSITSSADPKPRRQQQNTNKAENEAKKEEPVQGN